MFRCCLAPTLSLLINARRQKNLIMKMSLIITVALLLPILSIGQGNFEEITPSLDNESLYKTKRDTNGNKITETYFNQDGTQVNWVRTVELDNRGNRLRRALKDTLGVFQEAVICSAPLIKSKYDERNNLIEISYWKNETIKTSHDCAHYHKEVMVYTKNDKEVTASFYTTRERLLSKIRFNYDENGNEEKVTYLNEDNSIREGDRSIVYVKYDSEGRQVMEMYKNEKNKMVKEKDKFSIVTTEYKTDCKIETFLNYKKEVLKKERVEEGRGITTRTPIKE